MQDVKHFLDWLKTVRDSKKATEPSSDAPASEVAAPSSTTEAHAAAPEQTAAPTVAAAEAAGPGTAAGVA